MRKILLAAVVATALFAVGAFAASFAVNSEDVASGNDAVSACAGSVLIDFDDPDAGDNGVWTVNGATARFFTTAENTIRATDCDGFRAQLALVASSTTSVSGDLLVADGLAHFTFSSDVPVSAITRASIVVDGKYLPTSAL